MSKKIRAIRKISVINGSNPCPEQDSQDFKITKIESGFKDDDGLKDMLRLPKILLSFNPYKILQS